MLQHLTNYHVQESTVKKEANEKDMINGSFDGADNDIIKPGNEYSHNMTTVTTQSENTTDDINCNSDNYFNEWEDGNWCWERDYDKFLVTVPTTSGNNSGDGRSKRRRMEPKKECCDSFDEWEDGNWCWERDYDKFPVSLSGVTTNDNKSRSCIYSKSNIGTVKSKESLSHSLPIDNGISGLHGSDNEIIGNNSNYDGIDDDERNKNVEDLNSTF